PQRVEHFLPRTDRVLVARDADDALLYRLEVRLNRRPHAILSTAAPHTAGQSRARPDSDGLDKTSSRKRHGSSYSFPDDVVVEDLSTLRNTSVAFCISSIVPSEMRAHCFSSGGKSRPTSTPSFAHASRNAAAVIVLPMSVKMKFVCESVDG